jgi:hypothetical protein
MEHSCCYCVCSTGTFLLLLYVLHWNILAVTLCSPLEHSCCYSMFSTGTFLLLLYVLHWIILAVTVCSPLEHSCCYCMFSTGTFLLLLYAPICSGKGQQHLLVTFLNILLTAHFSHSGSCSIIITSNFSFQL